MINDVINRPCLDITEPESNFCFCEEVALHYICTSLCCFLYIFANIPLMCPQNTLPTYPQSDKSTPDLPQSADLALHRIFYGDF